uniref:Uncharacterized protein n=1 Tax=Cacopsylla melanoneura TaxID=428564 RepID=A0A8D9DZ73_9HEMI
MEHHLEETLCESGVDKVPNSGESDARASGVAQTTAHQYSDSRSDQRTQTKHDQQDRLGQQKARPRSRTTMWRGNGRSGHDELRPAVSGSPAELRKHAKHFRTRNVAEERTARQSVDAPFVSVYAGLSAPHRRRHGDLLYTVRREEVQVSERTIFGENIKRRILKLCREAQQ